jgi:hypothetical protein
MVLNGLGMNLLLGEITQRVLLLAEIARTDKRPGQYGQGRSLRDRVSARYEIIHAYRDTRFNSAPSELAALIQVPYFIQCFERMKTRTVAWMGTFGTAGGW